MMQHFVSFQMSKSHEYVVFCSIGAVVNVFSRCSAWNKATGPKRLHSRRCRALQPAGNFWQELQRACILREALQCLWLHCQHLKGVVSLAAALPCRVLLCYSLLYLNQNMWFDYEIYCNLSNIFEKM